MLLPHKLAVPQHLEAAPFALVIVVARHIAVTVADFSHAVSSVSTRDLRPAKGEPAVSL